MMPAFPFLPSPYRLEHSLGKETIRRLHSCLEMQTYLSFAENSLPIYAPDKMPNDYLACLFFSCSYSIFCSCSSLSLVQWRGNGMDLRIVIAVVVEFIFSPVEFSLCHFYSLSPAGRFRFSYTVREKVISQGRLPWQRMCHKAHGAQEFTMESSRVLNL